MKIFIQCMTTFLVLLNVATAQDSESNPTTESGLQISGRSDEERCKFLLEVAQAYIKEEDFSSAINAYERVLEIDPKHQEARYIIGHVYINAKQYAKAEKQLIDLAEDFPEDFKLKNNLAWLYATAEDPQFRNGKKAVEIAQEAMVLAPNDHHVWSTLAEAYYVSGEYEKAYRAIMHMAGLAARHGSNITKESVDGYNEQIRKCKRAWDTQKILEGKDDEIED
jgi:tetratricopeptide (TPR) repeat protein